MATASPPRRVLIVEDDPDVRYVLRILLKLLGHRVEEAANGTDGLLRLLALRPDVALVDVGLPGLDGHALARTVRKLPGGANLFLVALTGYSSPDDRQRALAAGFDAHLAKPVAESELLQILAH
jgi:CheY-like chemotaxis protein